MDIGYDKNIAMLAFDHRGTLSKHLLNIEGEPNDEQTKKIEHYKWIIYQGFQQGIALGIPKDEAAILVDEQYGDKVIEDARAQGYTFCIDVEKSGQKEFSFEFGDKYAEHIEKYGPPLVKALVRYNPEDEQSLNDRQLEKLKVLSEYCHKNNHKLLVEPIIGATDAELAEFGGSQERFDLELRPSLEVKMIGQFQAAGVEVDIWKIEGLTSREHYQNVVTQARSEGRDNVAVIVLGRGADSAQVDAWLTAGRQVPGIQGFAIGRTIFWQPLSDLRDGKITDDEAAGQIAQNYWHFYQTFAK